MKLLKSTNFIFLLFLWTSAVSQTLDWRQTLIPLKSDRKDVEKVLGKPLKYLPTFGIYETSFGKFYVWYSSGKCKKNAEGDYWKVPAQKLTKIFSYTQTALPLEHYITDRNEYRKVIHPIYKIRAFYFSADESIIYQTITPENGVEFVDSIELQPNKSKKYLLCPKK